MVAPKIKGGLDLPDFEITDKVLKVTWITKIHETNDNHCKLAPHSSYTFKAGRR